MKPLILLLMLPLAGLFVSFAPPEFRRPAPKEMEQCAAVKMIAHALADGKYDKVQGKAIDDWDEEYESLVTIKGYKEASVTEDDSEIYFETRFNKVFNNEGEIKVQLKKIAGELEKCLNLKPEELVTPNFIFYIFDFGNDVEVELTANYPSQERRYINLEIMRKKN